MFSLRLILAAGSLSTLISGAPVPSFPSDIAARAASSHSLQERSTYITTYGGNGEVSDGWPAQSAWVSSLDDMFTANNGILTTSCTQFSVPNNSADEIASMKTAINSVASSTGVDARFIFAIIMQESNGCVRAPTTNYGVRNPGLMQDHNGAGTCNDGSVQNPCPASEIEQMITDGTAGTSSGDGLKQCLAASGATDVSQYYIAARIYNSGSVDSTKNLGAGIATHCYASDIANRLTGWSSGPSTCNSGTVGSLTGTVAAAGSADTSSVSSAAPVASSSTAAAAPGGIFAATSASSGGAPAVATTSAAATETTTTAIPAPSPTTTSTSTTAPTETVVPVPVASSSSASSAAPVATSTPPSSSSSTTSSSSSSGAITPGTACTTEGEWNCIDGNSFQQCGSGTWSVVNQLAAGTACTVGQGASIDIHAIVTKRVVRERARL